MKKLLLITIALTSTYIHADVKQFRNIKLKENVVTAVRGSNGIIADENSNLSTDYKGITYTNFVITGEYENDWYKCTAGEGGIFDIEIRCQSRSSARFVTSLELSVVDIKYPTNYINGINQSFFEFDCLSTNSFTVTYPPNTGFSNSNSFKGTVNGSSTNLVCISSIYSNKFEVVSTRVEQSN